MKAIIVDDEKGSRNLLFEILSLEYPEIEVVGQAANAQEGIELIRMQEPELVFLDINMPKMDGFGMLEALQPVHFETVFITAYNQFAIKAFKYNAFGYLLKPIDSEELGEVIARLKERKAKGDLHLRLQNLLAQLEQPDKLPPRITIHSMDGITVINIADIMYLEAAGAYTIFYWNQNEKIISSTNLKEYESLLNEHGFCRVHNSFLVNLRQVRKILKENGGYILMANNARILLSKRKREEFLKRLEQH